MSSLNLVTHRSDNPVNMIYTFSMHKTICYIIHIIHIFDR